MAHLNHGISGVEGILCPGRGAKSIGQYGMTDGNSGMTIRQARRMVEKLKIKDPKPTRKPANGFG
jgi:hypothetical protein